MATKLDLRLAGSANNLHVVVTAKGTFDARARALSIQAAWEHAPLTMDPAILLLAATAWIVAAPWPKAASSGADPLVVRTWAQVLDDDGKDAGEIKLALDVRRNAAGLAILGEIARCTLAFEVGERVTGVGQSAGVVQPGGDEMLLITSAGTLQTSRGHDYLVLATVAICGLLVREPDQPREVRTDWTLSRPTPSSALLRARAR